MNCHRSVFAICLAALMLTHVRGVLASNELLLRKPAKVRFHKQVVNTTSTSAGSRLPIPQLRP
jgi:hypothetical protein